MKYGLRKFIEEGADRHTLEIYVDRGNETKGLATFIIGTDEWFYPADLEGEDVVINAFTDDEGKNEINVYSLPDNWRSIVTNDSGLDHKPSIHDVMQLDSSMVIE